MKKFFLMGFCAVFLAACYCKCTPQQPQTQGTVTSADSNEIPSAAAMPPAKALPATVITPSAAKPATTLQAETTAAPTTDKNTSETTNAVSLGFTPEQASALIARERAKQTLANPQQDTPVFKNEEFLPTAGRLLSPLTYEPVLPDNTHAPWSNEQLKYGIYYSFIKAGTAYIKSRGITEYNGKKAYLIQTTAFSASAIDAVFKVRDINFSWIDVKTHYSLGYAQSLREGNYVRDEWLNFEPENKRYYGEVKKKDAPRTIAGELDQPMLDMLSSLYFVRSQPLEAGKDISFDIINREERYPLLVKVLGKETVKTKAGKFNCWVVEPQFRGEGIFVAKGKSLKVWLTDDAYRMPVKMAVEVFIGSVYAELLDYKRN